MVGAGLVLTACGQEGAPVAGDDGRVDATPRALAAIVIDHVDPGSPRRTTGSWADWNDPPAVEAQVDYGVDPEGTESGETRTVRVDVASVDAFSREDRRWFDCRAEEGAHCESTKVEGGTLLYRWSPGAEEDPARLSWTVVRSDEVVSVAYDGSQMYDDDPRNLDLPVDPDDLRAAALDPAMSLRTTVDAWEQGDALDNYDGMEKPPEEPEIRPTTPRELAARVVDYGDLEPDSVGRSPLNDFGPGAVGARLEFSAGKGYEPFTVDILTTTGRVPQIDPLPCPIQQSAAAAERACFAWDRDSAATWTLASDGRPGVLWIVGAHYDDRFNRVESVGLRIESKGLVEPFFTKGDAPRNGLPRDYFGSVYTVIYDLSIGPETAVAR